MERTLADQLGAAKRKLDAAHNSQRDRRTYERDRLYGGGGSGSNTYSGGGSRDSGNRDR